MGGSTRPHHPQGQELVTRTLQPVLVGPVEHGGGDVQMKTVRKISEAEVAEAPSAYFLPIDIRYELFYLPIVTR
jgi:hypothetical protein